MAGVKIVTRKLVEWHGREEEFSNVYFFGNGGLGLSPDEATTETLLDMVIAAEKLVHATSVRFLGGAGYHMGVADTAGDTDAIFIRELAASGNQGAATATVGMYRECAVDIKWLLGGRRYLRTMLHTCSLHGYAADGAGNGTASASLSAEIKAFAQKMLNGTWTGGYERIAPNGDRPSAIMYNPYLEHRQFHRYRRRNAGLLG